MNFMFYAAPLLLVASLGAAAAQPVIGVRTGRVIEAGGAKFRDANRNGRLDAYEDWRKPARMRARDLLRRMTLEEKAGMVMHGTLPAAGNPAGFSTTGYDLATARRLILQSQVTSMISRLSMAPAQLAAQNNAIQAIAEEGRLGIPMTLSTDPRHHFQYVPGATTQGNGLSQWPEPLGFGALDDAELTRRFGDIARQEYRALGFHMALSPQADLATEPRWPRVVGTFSEDPEIVYRQTRAYIEGFQNGANGVGPQSVAAIVKHWVGYGAAKDGWDSHNYYGRFAQISEAALARHIRPFEGAFAAKVAGVMPTYSILEGLSLKGKPVEQVGAGFNRGLLAGLLRGQYRFDGLIVSDWAITNDCGEICRNGFPAGQPPTPRGIAMPWGVESLSTAEKFARGVNAGIDQFGGTEDSAQLLAAVRQGSISPKTLDERVLRVLTLKFELGLFENPYVEETAAAVKPGFLQAGHETQARSMVLLRNESNVLPLEKGRRVYLSGVDAEAARRAGLAVASSPEQADVAIVRASAPFQVLHPNYFFGVRYHEGDLDFKEDAPTLRTLRALRGKVPVVLAIYLDRPAILTNLVPETQAILANFGASDAALFDALLGRMAPAGRLPFELPRSMDSVRRQRSDTPGDSGDPLFARGAGLRFR